MKAKVITATFCVLLFATSIMAAAAPPVDAQLVQINTSPEMFAFRGPVDLQYQLTIQNPLVDQTITLRRITLRTQGPSAYSLQADDSINVTVYPRSSVTVNLSDWGISSGGFMKDQVPVTMMVQLFFDRQNGNSFVKQFVEYLTEY